MSGASHAVDQATASNGGDENFLGALRGIETPGAAPDIGENFLHGIFGIGGVSDGKYATIFALSHLRDTLSKIGALVAPTLLGVGPWPDVFDENGAPNEPSIKWKVGQTVRELLIHVVAGNLWAGELMAGIIGAAVTRAALVEFHRDRYRPDHAIIGVSGDITLADARALARALVDVGSAAGKQVKILTVGKKGNDSLRRDYRDLNVENNTLREVRTIDPEVTGTPVREGFVGQDAAACRNLLGLKSDAPVLQTRTFSDFVYSRVFDYAHFGDPDRYWMREGRVPSAGAVACSWAMTATSPLRNLIVSRSLQHVPGNPSAPFTTP